ncbi:OmpA family protein [Methylomicrobium sp. Wu6]|uniref:OmpA family protein n=1 Tax=Methylomicrobium sp. Wu6 TaxID=3107928 RepID=UPI002DD6309F|nr:OmpA family protein [Methylomicrobium sp. Wu6]MEC4747280.1 OmpA family protein [Methylomicrobium sp. Wu6]
MRKAINAISLTFFGASILIFISALLIPLLRESASQGRDKPEIYEAFGPLRKPIEKSVQEQTQNADIPTKVESSTAQIEGKVEQNDNAIDTNRVNSSAMQTRPTSPEIAVPQIGEKLPEPVNPIAAEEKPASQYGPMSLLVLGEGSFATGGIKPKANAQEAIDKIIPLIQARSLDIVIVEGHADKSIPDGFSPVQAWKWNKIVSMQRAKAVAQVLTQKGVASDRIIVKGLGDAVPLASNRTYKGRAKNRRVEIKLSSLR